MADLTPAKRIVIKVGTSTLTHESGLLNIRRVEQLVKVLADLKNSGRQIVLVTSGAMGVGVGKLGLAGRPADMPGKQAVAAVGQCELMYIYDKYFSEYNHTTAQVLLTRDVTEQPARKQNVQNTFCRLLELGAIPIVNENDTVSTYEIRFGDNDTLSAIVSALTGADLLILLSDIDGLYTDDPKVNPDAELITYVEEFSPEYMEMASSAPGSEMGTGGMVTKIKAARIATASGVDMIIANGKDFGILHHIFENRFTGTFFKANYDENFDILDLLEEE